jgi:hypothetical protein
MKKMATTRLFGKEVEVRMGTATSELTTCAAMSNVESIEWNKDPNIDSTPAGLGSNLMVNMQRIAKFSGSMSRWYNADDVCCGDTGHEGTCGDAGTFAAVVGAYETGILTPLYIEITNITTGEVIELQRCIGKYSQPISSPEGYIMEKWDFNFEDIDYTP